MYYYVFIFVIKLCSLVCGVIEYTAEDYNVLEDKADMAEVELQNLVEKLTEEISWFKYVGNMTLFCADAAKKQDTILLAVEELHDCLERTYKTCASEFASESGCDKPAHHISPCGHFRLGYRNPIQQYNPGQDCWWTLEVPEEFAINLTIDEFYMEYSGPQCYYDYMIVYDGDSSHNRSFGKMCGRRLQFSLYSSSNKMLIYAHTDDSVGKIGFRGVYQVMDSGFGKILSNATVLTEPTGYITLQMFTPVLYYQTYNYNSWIYYYQYHIHIKAKYGYCVRLNFTIYLDVNASVTIRNLPLDDGNYAKSPHWMSWNNSIFIQGPWFNSKSFVQSIFLRRGNLTDRTTLKINYETFPIRNLSQAHSSQCYGEANIFLSPDGLGRWISLPNTALLYPDSPIQCYWNITTVSGFFIQLKIEYVSNSPNIDNCFYEGFILADGTDFSDDVRKIGPFCDNEPGSLFSEGMRGVTNFTSSNNSLIVMMYSFLDYRASPEKRGSFKAYIIATRCLGILQPCSLPIPTVMHRHGHYRMTVDGNNDTINVTFFCNKSQCCVIQQFPIFRRMEYHTCNITVQTEGKKNVATTLMRTHLSVHSKNDTEVKYGCQKRTLERPRSSRLRCLGSALYFVYNSTSPWATASFIIRMEESKCGYYNPDIHDNPELYPPCALAELPYRNATYSIKYVDYFYEKGRYFTFDFNVKKKICEAKINSEQCLLVDIGIEDQVGVVKWSSLNLPFTLYPWPASGGHWSRVLHIDVKHHPNCKVNDQKTACPLTIDFNEHYLHQKTYQSNHDKLQCPQGYLKIWKTCLKIAKIKGSISEVELSFDEAESLCQKHGGHLVAIDNKYEMEAIKRYAFTHLWEQFLQFTPGTKVIFIGLRYLEQDKIMKWLNGQPLIYQEWNVKYTGYPRPVSFIYNIGKVQQAIRSNHIQEQLQKVQPSADKGHNCVAMVMDNPFEKAVWVKIPCDVKIKGALPLCEVQPKNYSLPLKQDIISEKHNHHKDFFTTTIGRSNGMNVLNPAKRTCPVPFILFGETCIGIFTRDDYVTQAYAFKECSKGEYKELFKDQDNIFGDYNFSPRNAMFRLSEINLLKEMLPALMHGKYSGKIRLHILGSKPKDCDSLSPIEKHNENGETITHWELMSLATVTTNNPYPCMQRDKEERDERHRNLTNFICKSRPIDYRNTCGVQQFECGDGTCILNHNVCDGTKDCLDGTDEQNCTNVCQFSSSEVFDSTSCFTKQCSPGVCTCSDLYIQCLTGGCIPVSKVCNYHHDCEDGYDEMACNHDTCDKKREFTCKSGECILSDQRCDFITDCTDESDELDCDFKSLCAKEKNKYHTCNNGSCIGKHHINDLIPDCPDKSSSPPGDEVGYKNIFNDAEQQGFTSSDSCTGMTTTCGPLIPKCFQKNDSCVYDRDRENNLVSCRNAAHLLNCAAIQCANMFKCPNSYCLPLRYICDGHFDCIYGEDEAKCEHFICPGMFKCKKENQCIPQIEVCDGIPHCRLSKEDEELCKYKEKGCPSNSICYGNFIEYDGEEQGILKDVDDWLLQIDGNNTKALILQNNKLELIPPRLAKFVKLHRLDLSYNLINAFDESFEEMKGLVELHITHNRIASITKPYFKELTHLRILNLHHNLITHILEECFIGLISLPELDLSYQQLRTIQGFHFRGLKSLKKLHLQGNYIDSIENNSFSDKDENGETIGLTQLEHLDISKNPISQAEIQSFKMLPVKMFLLSDRYKFCCFSRHIKQCHPGPDEFSSCEEMISHNVLRVLIWGIAILALLGNLIVLQQRMKHERETSPSLLVQHLSFSDMLMGVYLMIIACADQYYKHVYILNVDTWRAHALCKVSGFLSMMSCEMSSFLMMIITIDRLYACVPIFGGTGLSIRKTKGCIALGWTLSAIMSLIPILEFPYFGADGYVRSGICTTFNVIKGKINGWEYSMAVFIVFNSICYVVSGIGYFIVLIKVLQGYDIWEKYLSEDLDEEGKENERLFRKNEMIIASRLFLSVLTNTVVWCPLITVSIMTLMNYSLDKNTLAWISLFIMPLNAAINPCLYTFSTKPYRILHDDLLANWSRENDEDMMEGEEDGKYETEMGESSMSGSSSLGNKSCKTAEQPAEEAS